MKVNYQNQDIRKALLSTKVATRRYGRILSEKIFKTMQYLEAAPNLSSVSQFPPYRRHKLVGNYEGCFAVDLTKNQRLVFCPIDSSEKTSDKLDKIKEISIMAIEDYH